MKISKGLILDLCRISAILILILCIVLWFNQKPNFSKYHSYAVETESGYIPLTDEQFQQITQNYISEDLQHCWLAHKTGHRLILYKSDDMSGNCVNMYTGVTYPISYLCIDNRCFVFDGNAPDVAEQIIEEAINQSESEQEL